MTPPANLSERRVLTWMCVLIAINQLGFGAIVPTISLYAKSFGVSTFLIGMAIAIFATVTADGIDRYAFIAVALVVVQPYHSATGIDRS